MKRTQLRFGEGFRVALRNRRVYVPPAYTKAGDERPRGRR